MTKPRPAPTFAVLLKALRERASITQAELARRAGVSRQEVSRLEMGQRDPIWSVVQKLATALDCSTEELRYIRALIPPPPARPRGRPRKGRREGNQ